MWPTVHLQWLISVTLAIVAAHVLCRFAHATSISVVATAAYLVALVLARAAGRDLAGDAFWLVVANALGMIGSRHTEAQRRLAWSQTQLLDVERVRSEQLLLNVLPPSIAERLKCGERRIADAAAEVTVLFADIVGFTVLSQRVGAEEFVSTPWTTSSLLSTK